MTYHHGVPPRDERRRWSSEHRVSFLVRTPVSLPRQSLESVGLPGTGPHFRCPACPWPAAHSDYVKMLGYQHLAYRHYRHPRQDRL